MINIETPEAMAARLDLGVAHSALYFAIRARDAQIAEWCEGKAAGANKEAEAQEEQVTGEHGHHISDASHHDRAIRCEAQASALLALAALLRGGDL